ncbi:MAG: ABC transporter substrate-binding protein [Alphaproteobacteria bacterium]
MLLFGLAGAGVSARADDAEDAAKFIQDFGHRAIDSLTDKSLTDKELVERFRNLFREGFDVPYIARSALGRFWPRATDAEKKEYVPLFEDYIVEVYASQFRDYSGEMFKATTAYQAADGVVDVASDVVRSDGPTTKVDWYVAKVDGTFKIQDVKIEGVSMITTHRDTFANEILQHNGQVSGLIEALRSKTALLRSDAGNG